MKKQIIAEICIIMVSYVAISLAKENTIIDEELPIGVFAVNKDLLYLAKMKGFEIVHNYEFEERKNIDDELKTYLDLAESFGLKVMVGFGRNNEFEQGNAIDRVNKFKKHPALWAWYLYDEPALDKLKRAKKVAEAIKGCDTEHPVIVASDRPEYIELADMSFSYCYPVKDKQFPKEDLGSYIRKLDLIKVFDKPIVCLVQTFNWNHYLKFKEKREDNRTPNLEEMRFMAYSGIIEGCKGVFFFSFQTLPIEFDHLNLEVAPLIKELKMIRPYLKYKNLNTNDYIGSLSKISVGVWGNKNIAMLIVANPAQNKTTFIIKTEKRQVINLRQRKQNVKAMEKLGPWETKIYLIKNKGGNENTFN